MKSFLLLAILSTVICVSVSASAGTWYVDGSASSSGDGLSWEAAVKTIQEGIDAASEGDEVIVAENVYVENIQFNGKNIVLTSTAPLNPTVVANTVIDGNKAGSVVTFSGTESEACVVSGFTIRNGATSGSGGGIYGGAWYKPTQATIQNNTITSNSAQSGGGLGFCWGTIQSNTITGNSAEQYGGGLCGCGGTIQNNTITANSAVYDGGGLSSCQGTIQNNTVTGNSAGGSGGGLTYCDGTVQDNTITANSARYYGGGLAECLGTIQNNTIAVNSATEWGGGLYYCNGRILKNTVAGNSAIKGGGLGICGGTIQDNTITGNSAGSWGGGLANCSGTIQDNTVMGNSAPGGGGLSWCGGTIQNNVITGNSAGAGGGLSECHGTIQNNTIAGNWAGAGGGLDRCNGTTRNCIIWANWAPAGLQLHDSSIPTYSCIQGWAGDPQTRNISEDPRFVDPDGLDDHPETCEDNDYRLSAGSPCIDAGYNDPALPAADIARMHRIMFGGKSLTVDVGAWEYYINTPSLAPGGNAVLTWSSLAGKTYRVYHSGDMLVWDVLTDNVASAGDTVTTWIDSMGPVLPPGVRMRYYKVMENP